MDGEHKPAQSQIIRLDAIKQVSVFEAAGPGDAFGFEVEAVGGRPVGVGRLKLRGSAFKQDGHAGKCGGGSVGNFERAERLAVDGALFCAVPVLQFHAGDGARGQPKALRLSGGERDFFDAVMAFRGNSREAVRGNGVRDFRKRRCGHGGFRRRDSLRWRP